MKSANFVHLHVHSEYSLLDGMCRLNKLIERAQQLNMPAVAVTDHGNMYGIIDFYSKAKEAGIKPIVGMEAYVAPGSRTERKAHGIKDAAFHLTLLASNYQGYTNLLKLSSIGFLEGFYYRPRIDKDALRQYASGLIALSGCLKGELSHLVLTGQEEQAEKCLREYLDIFGRENYYLEVQNQGIEGQTTFNAWCRQLARKYDLRVVATNDCHYLDREQAFMHEVLLCIQTVTNIYDSKRLKFPNMEFSFKDATQMQALFPDLPEVLENSVRIADRCKLELDFSQRHLPTYHPPGGQKREVYLRALCQQGLSQRYQQITPEIKKRLEHELSIIEKMKFSSYFLIVWDFINFARQNNIPVGPGRGSAAGSLVSYLLGITNIDPLRYGLLFERFLNPSRISLPDIDIDFCDRRRDEIIEYVRSKYGKNNVAQIITFGTLGAKAVIRDVGRGLGLSYAEADRIAKLIPNELNITLERALELEPQLDKIAKEDQRIGKLLEVSYVLEGLVRNASTHAAGIVISEKPLTEYLPLATGNKGEVITQYAMGPVEKIGMLKMDFLGLKTLGVIQDTIDIVERLDKRKIDINNIPLDDKATFKLLNQANTIGIFQVESSGMRDLSRRMGLDNFNDLIALVALFRPGPMHMVDDYIARKKGKVAIKYDHSSLAPILKDTYGVMLYQEQVMQSANVIAGFDLAAADNLRRIMGKKKARQMEEQRDQFIEGAKEKGLSYIQAQRIFENMATFAGYGFNRSHSAAYALIAYQTAYLKANWPVAYLAALLTSEMNNTDKLSRYIEESRKMGIEVLPPDINQSEAQFTVVDNNIRFGLAAIKNVGTAAVRSIVDIRNEGGVFRDFMNFLERIDSRAVNKKVLESLIKCGALDSFSHPRQPLVAGLDQALSLASRRKEIRQSAQTSFFELLEEKDKGPSLTLPDIEEWPQAQLLNFEKELLGFYVTGHPLAEYEDLLRCYTSAGSRQLVRLAMTTKVRLGGIITNIKRTVTKRDSRRMAILTVDDLDGSAEVVVYPDAYDQYQQYIEQNKVVIITGQAQAQEEKPRVVAAEVIPLEEAPIRYADSVQINIPPPAGDNGVLEQVRNILNEYPGDCSLNMCLGLMTGERVTLAVNSELKVNPSREFINRIESLLGKGSIQVRKR